MNKVLYIVILLCFSVASVNAATGEWSKKKKRKAKSEKEGVPKGYLLFFIV